MLNKQYVSRRLLPIIVAFTLAFGCMITIQQSDSYANEPEVVSEGEITDTIYFMYYTDDTFVISGEGIIPNWMNWSDEAYEIIMDEEIYKTAKKVVVEEGITGIGSKAFFYNDSYCWNGIKCIELPSTLETIDSNAFGATLTNPMELDKVVFSEAGSLKTIGQNAFMGCKKIEELVIPEGVTKVDSYAFHGCSGLKKISFPSTITTFGVSVLYACTNLEEITFNAVEAAPLSYERNEMSGGGYAGFDSYIYYATADASYEGCLRKENGGQYGHDVIMRHPVGAVGYSDDNPTPTDGWMYYAANTWKTILPEQIQSVVDAIEVIDDPVTLDSEDAIVAARHAYDALSEEQQNMIDAKTLKKLTDAEDALAKLKLDDAKEKALAAFDVYDLSQYSGDELTRLKKVIADAKEAIDTATSVEEVTIAKNAGINEANSIKTDQEIIAPVIEVINAIGEVSLDDEKCESRIKAARQAYDALTDARKEIISDKFEQIIINAEQKFEILKQAAALEASNELIATLSSEIDALQSSSTADKDLIEDLKGQLEALQSVAEELAQSTATKEELTNQINTLNDTITALNNKIAELQNDDLNDKRKAAINEINKYVEENLANIDDVDKYDIEIAALRGILAVKDAEKEDDIKAAVDSVKSTVDVSAAKKAAKGLKIAGLKATSKKQKFTVKWTLNKKAEAYEVQYKLSSSKKFSSLKKGVTTGKIISKKLKKGKKYIFRVRTVKTVAGKKVYGKWAKTNGVKCR